MFDKKSLNRLTKSRFNCTISGQVLPLSTPTRARARGMRLAPWTVASPQPVPVCTMAWGPCAWSYFEDTSIQVILTLSSPRRQRLGNEPRSHARFPLARCSLKGACAPCLHHPPRGVVLLLVGVVKGGVFRAVSLETGCWGALPPLPYHLDTLVPNGGACTPFGRVDHIGSTYP